TNLLDIEDLTIRLQTRHGTGYPVKDVSLSLAPGDILGLVGESGSGKTMLARSIAGLHPQPAAEIIAGSIKYRGSDIVRLPEADLRRIRGSEIAYIFQDSLTALDPVYTAGYQVVEGIALHKPAPRADMRSAASALLQLLRV